MSSPLRGFGTAKLAGLGLLSILILPPASASGFKSMAKELSRDAKKAGIERVAVLPFVSAAGSGSADGWNISERLTTQVVRMGRVQTVERSLLRDLMEEHHLAQTGLINPEQLKKLGKIASADGVITGSFVILGREVVVNARLINVETGVVISASEERVDRELYASQEPASSNRADVFDVAVPELFVAAPVLPPGAPELRDAPADDPCIGASRRVDQLESQILEIKARYWAIRLKQGLSLTQLTTNPGSTISDPVLRQNFYARMQYWYGVQDVPELTPSEVQRFVSIDGKAFSLYRECGA